MNEVKDEIKSGKVRGRMEGGGEMRRRGDEEEGGGRKARGKDPDGEEE